MTVKELRNMIKNNEHISMTTFDELVEIADTKLSFFERIGEKGKLQREIIKSFDSIINLLDDKARPNVIHTEVKNESIRNKILAYTVRYLDDALSGKKGTRFDKRNLVKAYRIAYGDDFKSSENKTKLIEFLEDDTNVKKMIDTLFIGDFSEIFEWMFQEDNLKEKFANALRRNFDSYLEAAFSYSDLNSSLLFKEDSENMYYILSGNIEKFYNFIKDKGCRASYIFKATNFKDTFENHPEFKDEMLDVIERYSRQEDVKDEGFFEWMCSVYSQTDNLWFLATDLEQLFDSREDGRFAYLSYHISYYYENHPDADTQFRDEFLTLIHDRFYNGQIRPGNDYDWFIGAINRIDRKFLNDNIEKIADLVPPDKMFHYLRTLSTHPDAEKAQNVLAKKAKYILEKTDCPLLTRNLIEESENKFIERMKGETQPPRVNQEEIKEVMDKRGHDIAFEIGERFQDDPAKIDLLEKLLNELMQNEHVTPYDIRYLNRGSYSKVYQIGEKVLKIGWEPEHHIVPKNHRRLIQPLIRKTDLFSNGSGRDFYIEISEKCDMSQKPSKEELYEVFKELREDGLLWTDAFEGNVGRLKKANKPHFGRIGEIKEDNTIEWGSFSNAGSAQGLGKKDEPIETQNVLDEGELVVIDLDYIFDANDTKIAWPKGRYSREFEQRYQEEMRKKNLSQDKEEK